jgi:hypothetical protein
MVLCCGAAQINSICCVARACHLSVRFSALVSALCPLLTRVWSVGWWWCAADGFSADSALVLYNAESSASSAGAAAPDPAASEEVESAFEYIGQFRPLPHSL